MSYGVFRRRPTPQPNRFVPLSVTAAGGTISGEASIALDAITVAATGSLAINGSASITLDAITVAATGVVAITGTASITLGAITTSATGTLTINSSASITLGAITTSAQGYLLTNACINGVLAVSSNGRYFENDNGPLVLSGMHFWYDVQDGDDTDPPSAFDWPEYLDALVDYGHSVTKLWRLETARDWAGAAGQYFAPLPYARTGPGNAADGNPKFDLDTWDNEYFERIHARAIEAGNAGIYVVVQLFQGWHIDDKGLGGGADPWGYHPFENGNNINSVDGDVDNDGNGEEMRDTSVTALYNRSKAFVDKMVATLGDLDHVLWEVSNEDTHSGTALAWQRAIAAYIKSVDTAGHPVGITKLYPGGSNSDLFASTDADWISIDDDTAPNPDEADGSKVILWDTDHVFGVTDTYQWVLRSFTQGNNPIFMDVWSGANGIPDTRADADYILIRRLMGDVVAYSQRMDLLNAVPDGTLSDTGWCLASPTELFVYQDDTGAFDVDLSGHSGVFTVEWYQVSDGTTQAGSTVNGGASRTLTPPWSGVVAAFLSQGNSGEASITLGAITTTATGTLAINGTASITLGAITTSATGVLAINASASLTLDAITTVATGVLAVNGAASITLDAITTAATGSLAIAGAASITLDDVTVTAAGAQGNIIAGEAAITLDAITTAATGTLAITGAASVILDAVTTVATGQLSINAQAAITLGAITVNSLSTLAILGAATITLGAITVTATGGETEIEIATIAAIVYGPNNTGVVYGSQASVEIGA